MQHTFSESSHQIMECINGTKNVSTLRRKALIFRQVDSVFKLKIQLKMVLFQRIKKKNNYKCIAKQGCFTNNFEV